MDKLIENQKEMIEKDKLVTKAREEKFQSILCEIKEEQKKEREEWKDSFDKFKQQTTEEIEKMKLSLNEIVSNEIKKEKLSHFNIFSFNGNNSFNGILNHLRKKETRENAKLFDITSSSIYGSEKYKLQNVVIYEDNGKNFISKDLPDSWLCFDFKNHQIVPEHYTIRTAMVPCTSDCHPKSWVIEGSNDNNTWSIIDEFLNGQSKTHTFAIENHNSIEFKYIRMRLTDKTWSNQDYLAIDSLELFGILI